MRPIIIEGPDGSGKSTLALSLSRHFDMPIQHMSGPPLNEDEFYQRMLFLERHAYEYIFDRSPHISESVYAIALGRIPAYNIPEMLHRFGKLCPLVIYCRRRLNEHMLNSVLLQEKPYKPIEHIKGVMHQYNEIVIEYDKLLCQHIPGGTKVIYYDWEAMRIENLFGRINSCVD